MMNGDARSIGKCGAQFEKSDVRVLGHQFAEEPNMRRQFSASGWAPHRGDKGRARLLYLASPTRTGRRRYLQAA